MAKASRATTCLLAATAACLALPAIAPAQVPTQLPTRLAEAFGRAIVGAAGTEAQGTYEFDYLGIHVRIDILGVVFCQPPDPWAPPDPTPLPPLTAYGCAGSHVASAVVPPSGDTARITLTLDVIFADLATQRTLGFLCGELGTGTVGGDGYLLTSGTVVTDLALTQAGSCLQATLVPGSVVLTLGPVTAELEDGCISRYWGALSDQLLPDLQAAIQDGMASLIAGRMDAFNRELCVMTPVDDSSWGRVKGLYGWSESPRR